MHTTGDSITVAPALTLTDKEYQRMRDMARRIIRFIGVETGGSNIQFAINPDDGGSWRRDEPARLAIVGARVEGDRLSDRQDRREAGAGLSPDEIPNDITCLTPASFEPTIDYIVVKFPRWNFEKFLQADRTLTTQMKSVGRRWHRTFKEAFMKSVRCWSSAGSAGCSDTPDDAADQDEDDGAAEAPGRAE
jgi:carbamoyl-phosphate synthase large subunit